MGWGGKGRNDGERCDSTDKREDRIGRGVSVGARGGVREAERRKERGNEGDRQGKGNGGMRDKLM